MAKVAQHPLLRDHAGAVGGRLVLVLDNVRQGGLGDLGREGRTEAVFW